MPESSPAARTPQEFFDTLLGGIAGPKASSTDPLAPTRSLSVGGSCLIALTVLPLASHPDGRRVSATYDFDRDWWTAQPAEDPSTVFEGRWLHSVLHSLLPSNPGAAEGGPGPNYISLTEGRRNYAEQGISNPWLKERVTVRESLAEELGPAAVGPLIIGLGLCLAALGAWSYATG